MKHIILLSRQKNNITVMSDYVRDLSCFFWINIAPRCSYVYTPAKFKRTNGNLLFPFKKYKVKEARK